MILNNIIENVILFPVFVSSYGIGGRSFRPSPHREQAGSKMRAKMKLELACSRNGFFFSTHGEHSGLVSCFSHALNCHKNFLSKNRRFLLRKSGSKAGSKVCFRTILLLGTTAKQGNHVERRRQQNNADITHCNHYNNH